VVEFATKECEVGVVHEGGVTPRLLCGPGERRREHAADPNVAESIDTVVDEGGAAAATKPKVGHRDDPVPGA